MQESLWFYQEVVGLKLERLFQAAPGMEIAFLGSGETKIELIAADNNENIEVGKDISWGFETESIDDMIEFVKEKGLSIHSGPFQPNPHTRFFYVLDPNGMKIQFVEIS